MRGAVACRFAAETGGFMHQRRLVISRAAYVRTVKTTSGRSGYRLWTPPDVVRGASSVLARRMMTVRWRRSGPWRACALAVSTAMLNRDVINITMHFPIQRMKRLLASGLLPQRPGQTVKALVPMSFADLRRLVACGTRPASSRQILPLNAH
jgi:hypothetical protein